MPKLLYDCLVYEYKAGDEVNMYEIDKGDNNMFDVNNIKIGDYVEFEKDGINYIGYLEKFLLNSSGEIFALKVRTNSGIGFIFTKDVPTLKTYFKQIGVYKFDEDKVDKKLKIEKIDGNRVMHSEMDTITDIIMFKKINEIIDHLNKE